MTGIRQRRTTAPQAAACEIRRRTTAKTSATSMSARTSSNSFARANEERGKRGLPPKSLANFDIAPFVTCILGDDLEKCRMPVKGMLALYVGGMGARGKNFYNDYAKRLGYEGEALKIQDLYLAGKKEEAMAAVPNALVDAVALVGPKERIRDRIQAWKAHQVPTLLIGSGQPEALRLLAELCL